MLEQLLQLALLYLIFIGFSSIIDSIVRKWYELIILKYT